MSKAEILQELPGLGLDERQEILERLCELEERDSISGVSLPNDEKQVLDKELEEFRANPNAGSSWQDVEARLRSSSQR